MHKNIVISIALAFLITSCSSDPKIQTRSLPKPNPTSYLFPASPEVVLEKGLQAFSIDHQIEKPIFGRSTMTTNPLEIPQEILTVECATNAVFGEAIFKDPANAHDIYLHSFGMPFVKSAVYHGDKGNLPFIANFQLHLTPSGSNTTVSVITSGTEVLNGSKFGFGP